MYCSLVSSGVVFWNDDVSGVMMFSTVMTCWYDQVLDVFYDDEVLFSVMIIPFWLTFTWWRINSGYCDIAEPAYLESSLCWDLLTFHIVVLPCLLTRLSLKTDVITFDGFGILFIVLSYWTFNCSYQIVYYFCIYSLFFVYFKKILENYNCLFSYGWVIKQSKITDHSGRDRDIVMHHCQHITG